MTRNSVVLITGASTGLGLAAAVRCAQEGCIVYATMRNTARQQALLDAARQAGVSINVLPLDVEDTDSVNQAVDTIIGKEGRLDVLIANAGIGFARSTEQASESDIAHVMNVNFMGMVRCVKAVIPTFRQQRSGRIIAITSVGGLIGQPFNEIYCASKFAVEGFIESMASYVGPAFGIHFTAVEPGGISSEFANSALKQIEQSGGLLDDEYLPILQKYLTNRETNNDDSMFQTPEQVADVVLACMTAEQPPIRKRTSHWAEQFTRLKTEADPDGRKAQAKVIDEILGGF